MDAIQTRLKKLELLGGLGAGVLGAGLALLFSKWLQPFAVPALMVGIIVHGWAMFAKSRLEQRSKIDQPTWAIGRAGLLVNARRLDSIYRRCQTILS